MDARGQEAPEALGLLGPAEALHLVVGELPVLGQLNAELQAARLDRRAPAMALQDADSHGLVLRLNSPLLVVQGVELLELLLRDGHVAQLRLWLRAGLDSRSRADGATAPDRGIASRA